MKQSLRHSLGFCLLLTTLTLLAYTPAMTGGFLWDDNDHIEACPQLRTLHGLYEIWFEPGATVQYYPLTFTGFWIGYQIWGLTTWPYHLMNVLLHAAVALLLWRVLKALKVPGAWLAGLIFALHPVHVMSVAWMTELKNTLSGALFLGALWSYLRFAGLGAYAVGPAVPAAGPARKTAGTAGPTRWWFYALAIGLFILAMFAKTATSLLVLTLLLILWWQGRRMTWREVLLVLAVLCSGDALARLPVLVQEYHAAAVAVPAQTLPAFVVARPSWVGLFQRELLAIAAAGALWAVVGLFRRRTSFRDILPLAPFLLVMTAFGSITLRVEQAHGAWGADYALTLVQKALIAGRAFWFYAGKLVCPYPLTFIYPRWVIDSGAWWQYLFPAAVLAAVVGLWRGRRRWGRGPLVAVLYSFVGSAGLVFIVVTFMTRFSWVADHWQYLGSMSLIALGAAALALGLQRAGAWGRPHANLLIVVVVGTLWGLTWEQAHVYQSMRALWEDTLAKNDGSSLAHNNYGGYLDSVGETEKARQHWEKAIALDPRNDGAMRYLGGYHLRAGHYDQALQYYAQAAEINAYVATLQSEMGQALVQQGRIEQALPCFRNALRLDPKLVSAHTHYAKALLGLDRYDEARQHLEAALALQPHDAAARAGLASLLVREGRLAEAVTQYDEALRLDPQLAEARYNLGSALLRLGQWRPAIECYIRAVRALPALAHSGPHLDADGFAKVGQEIARCEDVLRQQPDDPQAHVTLARIMLGLGHIAGAVEHYQGALRGDPKQPAVHTDLAALLVADRQLGPAIEHCREALRLQPALPEAQNILGQALEAQGQLGPAVAAYRAALRLNPAFTQARLNLGRALAAQGEPGAAESELRQTLAAQPTHAQAHRSLSELLDQQAAAHAQAGRFPEAIAVAREAAEHAVAAGQPELIARIRAHITAYQAGQLAPR